MANKKSNAKGAKVAKELTAEGAENAEEKGASTSSATDGLVDGQWRVGSWHGMEMHTCVHCQWDTLEGIWAAREHKAQCVKCAPPPAVRERVTSEVVMVADRWGNPIAPPVGEE